MLSIFLIALVCASNAQTPKAALLALSKRDHTLAIIDPADLKVVATVPVGDDPHEMAASANGRTAYVSNYGFGSLHTLAVVDLTGHKPFKPIELGLAGASWAGLHPRKGLVYSRSCEGDWQL